MTPMTTPTEPTSRRWDTPASSPVKSNGRTVPTHYVSVRSRLTTVVEAILGRWRDWSSFPTPYGLRAADAAGLLTLTISSATGPGTVVEAIPVLELTLVRRVCNSGGVAGAFVAAEAAPEASGAQFSRAIAGRAVWDYAWSAVTDAAGLWLQRFS